MTTTEARIARAAHDLNDVREVRILGWTGPHEVAAFGYRSDRHVETQAPERDEGEFWTFTHQRDGVLTCFTSLLGSPSLLGPTGLTMTVYLPADRMDDVKVTFQAPDAAGEQS